VNRGHRKFKATLILNHGAQRRAGERVRLGNRPKKMHATTHVTAEAKRTWGGKVFLLKEMLHPVKRKIDGGSQ